MKTLQRLLLAAALAACGVGDRNDANQPPTAACRTSADFDSRASCVIADGRSGYCAPETGACAVECSETERMCWSWTYAWLGDPQREHDPICYCIDEDQP